MKKKNKELSLFEIAYKVKEVSDGKIKTMTKKATVAAETDKDAVISFAQTGEPGQVVSIRKVNIRELRNK